MTGAVTPPGDAPVDVTVGIVAVCSTSHLERCLAGLARQRQAPRFEIVAACDPRLPGLADVRHRYPEVRILAGPEREPVGLAARAALGASGDFILLTEDHCVPGPDWVRRLSDALRNGEMGAAGGAIDHPGDVSNFDWAFYFVDYFRYMPPVARGPVTALSVCNVGYRRRDLEAVADCWLDGFQETNTHDRLRALAGPLHMIDGAGVVSHRRVRRLDGLRERYAFGRLYGATRRDPAGGRLRRVAAVAVLPLLLPPLLYTRMARRAFPIPPARTRFLRASLPLTGLLAAWSLGEWIGRLTRRRPAAATTAPDLGAMGG